MKKKSKSIYNITDLSCRVCLKKCNQSNKDWNNVLSQRYKECTSFTVKDQDIPKKICKVCNLQLEKFCKFRSVAAKTEKQLTKFMTPPKDDNLIALNFIEIKNEYDSSVGFFDEDQNYKNNSSEQVVVPTLKVEVNNESKVKLEKPTNDSDFEVESLPLEESIKQKKSKYERRCKECSASFKSSRQLEVHKTQVHTEMIEFYYCDICDDKRPFLLRSAIFDHMRVNHLNKKKRKEKACCPYCEKVLSNKHSLKYHIERMHTKTELFVCQYCADGYNTKDKLHRHVSKMHNDRFECEMFICHFCGKAYNEKSPLLYHIKFHHLQIRAQKQCPHCDFETYSSSRLKEHICRSHMKEEDWEFSCEYCTKKFITKTALKIHVQGHEGVKDIPCPICNSVFRNKRQMKNHYIAIHEPGNHLCKYCQKVFTTERYLKQHLKIHLENGYECPLCPEKKFSFVTTLRSHITSNHPHIPLPPPRTQLRNFDWSKIGFD